MDDPEEKPRYGAPALDKGLDVLELLAGEPAGLGLSEIAQRLGRTTGEIFRMVRALERRRYIAPDGADGFALTLRLFELAHRHPPLQRLTATAVPLMQSLARRVQQSCHLAILHDHRLLVVAQVESPANMGFAVRLGAQLSLVSTPSGHVMLAFRDAAARAALLAPLAGTFDATALDGQLDRIAKRGFECVDSYEVRGVRPVSFPVFDMSGDIAAVLTVPFMERMERDAIPIKQVRDALCDVARAVSRRLGAPQA